MPLSLSSVVGSVVMYYYYLDLLELSPCITYNRAPRSCGLEFFCQELFPNPEYSDGCVGDYIPAIIWWMWDTEMGHDTTKHPGRSRCSNALSFPSESNAGCCTELQDPAEEAAGVCNQL